MARRSGIHGKGVFALRRIRKGEEIVHYTGTLRTHEDVDSACDERRDDGITFYFTLNDTYVVDAAAAGNVSRWINHGCRPNCEAVIEEGPGGDPRNDRILIRAIRDIPAGEELSYDYGITLESPLTAREKALWACYCGAAKCRGTLLQPQPPKRRRT